MDACAVFSDEKAKYEAEIAAIYSRHNPSDDIRACAERAVESRSDPTEQTAEFVACASDQCATGTACDDLWAEYQPPANKLKSTKQKLAMGGC